MRFRELALEQIVHTLNHSVLSENRRKCAINTPRRIKEYGIVPVNKMVLRGELNNEYVYAVIPMDIYEESIKRGEFCANLNGEIRPIAFLNWVNLITHNIEYL